MSTSNHITASCVISQGVVYKNEIPLFQSDAVDVKAFLGSIYQHFHFGYPKFYKMDHLSKLGWLTAEILLTDRVVNEHHQPGDTGVVLSNANASLDTDIKYYESVRSIASPALFVYTLPNIMIGEICIKNNFKGENAFFVSEAFDISFIHAYVSNLLDHDILQVCICGWVELLEQEYKAALFLVERIHDTMKDGKETFATPNLFTEQNIDKIYHLKNG